jgi:hypothetical protein
MTAKIDKNFLSELGLLTGWKRIASFLDVSVRTARRYAKLGMPVRNWPKGRPWAIPDELVRWGILVDELMKEKKPLKTCHTRPSKAK